MGCDFLRGSEITSYLLGTPGRSTSVLDTSDLDLIKYGRLVKAGKCGAMFFSILVLFSLKCLESSLGP